MRFSIITITFNSEKTIERTLKSVLNQSFKDYEYIIVDGDSKDNTMDIVRRYEPLFSGRMHWISEPDNGIYNAMNKGIRMAGGSIIGIVNSDDWLQDNTLKILNDTMTSYSLKEKDAFLLTGWMEFYYKDGTHQTIKRTKKQCYSAMRHARIMMNHPATWVSKKAYEIVGEFDENIKISADVDLMNRMYRCDVKFYFIEDVLVNMLDGGASNIFSIQMWRDRKYILHKHISSASLRFRLSLKWWIVSITKCFIPHSLLIKIRKND